MTKDTTYRCDFCHERLGMGYGINWTGKGGGDTINFVTDTHNAKQLEHHLCLRCIGQIAGEHERTKTVLGSAVNFGDKV